MSKVFLFILAMVVFNVFVGWSVTEIGQHVVLLETGVNFNATSTPTESETETGVLGMLWDIATFNIEGIDRSLQVLIFGTLNTCMAIAIFFVLRGVG